MVLWRYYFEIGYGEKLIKLYLKEGIIPEEFIAYSKLSHKCKAENVEMKAEDLQRLLELRQELATVTAKYNEALNEKARIIANCKALKKEINDINKKMKNVDKSKKIINQNLQNRAQ